MGRSRWVCLHDLGTPGAIDRDRLRVLERERAQVSKEGLTLVTFGASDLLTIHLVDEPRFLAAMGTNAPVSHQRGQGGAIVDLPDDPLLLSPQEFLRPDPERPFYAVCSVKIDPLANLMAGPRLAEQLLRDLAGLVRSQFEDFDREARRWAQAFQLGPDAPPIEAGPDLGGLQLRPLLGLDCFEVIVVARAPRIEWLARLSWALRSLRGRHLAESLTGLEEDLELLDALPGLPLAGAHHLPIVSHSITTLGVPEPILREQPPGSDQRRACAQAVLSVRLSALPDRAVVTDALFAQLSELLGAGHAGALPRRATVFGDHDQVIYVGEGWANPLTGVVERGPAFRPLTWQQVFAALRVAPSSGDGATDGLRCETRIEVEAFPPASSRPDGALPTDGEEPESLQIWFDKQLRAARDAWLGPAAGAALYERLKQAGSDTNASYSSTNGALSMIQSLVTQVAGRRELDNYMDLIQPLDALIAGWVASAPGEPMPRYRAELGRDYNNLDRVMHARSHRDSPSRPPGVSRAFEARAGHVVPRDAFYAYLDHGLRGRVSDVTALLIDGTDSALTVKFALRTAIFSVSALRLHQPVLWPATAHEVEHARLVLEDAEPAWIDGATRLLRTAMRSAELECPADRNGRRTWEAVLKEVVRSIESFPGKKKRLLLDVLHGAGRPHDAAPALIEVACDLALFDAGVLEAKGEQLTPDEMERRFLFTLIPNWAMDQRAVWSSELHDDLRNGWALDIGARIAAVLALAPLPFDADVGAIEQRLLTTLDSSRWAEATTAVLRESWGRRRGHKVDKEGIGLADARLATAAARTTLLELSRYALRRSTPSWWASILDLVNRLRRRSAWGPMRPAADNPRHAVAAHLRDAMAAHESSGCAELYPPLFSRGGLDPDGAAAQASNERMVGLYTSLRGAVRTSRLRATKRFFAPWP